MMNNAWDAFLRRWRLVVSHPAPGARPLVPLTISALGVVYGDIGTSPIYAMRECFFGTHSVPPTEANAIAQAQARKLAAKPLTALVEIKRLMKKSQQPALLERMGEEGQSFGRMLREPAAREAFTAFMEKRKPDFSKV